MGTDYGASFSLQHQLPRQSLILLLTGFCVTSLPGSQSVVKGDILHSEGLRVILFSTEDSLQILARAQIILADGTFRITPHLWYQTFIFSASFRENSFVP